MEEESKVVAYQDRTIEKRRETYEEKLERTRREEIERRYSEGAVQGKYKFKDPPFEDGLLRCKKGEEFPEDKSIQQVEAVEEIMGFEEGIPIDKFLTGEIVPDHDREFEILQSITETQFHFLDLVKLPQEYSHLNRYCDVLPYAYSEVRVHEDLTQKPNTWYVNANFINSCFSKNDRKFIAGQGPTKANVQNFWKACYQHEVTTVVMLCCLKEGGRPKCFQYWHENTTRPFNLGEEGYDLEFKNKKEKEGLVYRKFLLKNEKGWQGDCVVNQIQLTGWPDHGIPSEAHYPLITELIKFLEEEYKYSKKNQRVFFHCSAGIGRTGTMLAIFNIILFQKKYNELRDKEPWISKPILDVFSTVRRLREQRMNMVQTYVN